MTASGCLSPVALILFAYLRLLLFGGVITAGSFLAPEIFQNIGMLNADLGMLSAPGMLNLGMLNAGFGMLSASGMLNFFFHFARVLSSKC